MRANIQILKNTDDYVIIQDMGSWDTFLTVTNDAEGVVEYLFRNDLIKENQRLFYYDSSDDFDELLIEDRQFVGFGPGERKYQL